MLRYAPIPSSERAVIDSYTAILPALAEKARTLFIPLPAMPRIVDDIQI
jgi:hypothetical protein